MSYLSDRITSFGHAFRGIATLFREEPHARIHAVATAATVVLGVILPIARGDWLALAVAITAVWVAEGMNTAIEALCDTVHPEQAEGIKRTKDVAAGAVLIASLGALAVGLLVFVPAIYR